MINNELLSKLKELNRIETAAPADIDIHRDALILLQFNRNRILYDNIIRRELYDKLKYEAGKTFQLHCARLGVNPDSMLPDPAAEMLAMEQKAKAIEPAERKEKSMGKRQDHDLLPADIRNYFDTNSDLFMRMRKLHEALKTMDAAKPCDRYPYVSEMLKIDDQIAANWKKYDDYIMQDPAETTPVVTIDAKRISANRKYLSDNKDKLATLIAEASPKAETLRGKMQIRVNELLAANAGVSEEQLTELAKLGITV